MQHIQHGRPGREGARLDRVRLNETITDAVFGWRRRRVYARITALSGARPGYRILDIGCGGGYLAPLLAAAGGPGRPGNRGGPVRQSGPPRPAAGPRPPPLFRAARRPTPGRPARRLPVGTATRPPAPSPQ